MGVFQSHEPSGRVPEQVKLSDFERTPDRFDVLGHVADRVLPDVLRRPAVTDSPRIEQHDSKVGAR
jgi:hypothetical protein